MSHITLSEIYCHNFENVSLSLPKNKFIVITGPSGSGKSTLAIDIIYSESQRKFIQSLPSYARQFISLSDEAVIKKTEGLSPAIIIDQKIGSHNSRSTVGTVSEIYDYVRILYALLGKPHCEVCGEEISSVRVEEIGEEILFDAQNKSVEIAAHFGFSPKEKEKNFIALIGKGYYFYKVFDTLFEIRSYQKSEEVKKILERGEAMYYLQKKNHSLSSLSQAIEEAFMLSPMVRVRIAGNKEKVYTKDPYCFSCKKKKKVLPFDQKMFSFNLPTGACRYCQGTGRGFTLTHDDLSLMTEESFGKCSKCRGERLNPFALSIRLCGLNITKFCAFEINQYDTLLQKVEKEFILKKKAIEKPIKEIQRRVALLRDLGLGYLSLGRSTMTLSGGEFQRIRLAGQLGSGLTGVTYILDEPSIGLHQSDNSKLIRIMQHLRNIGNTVIVVEHDEETMRAADVIVDIGPGAGKNGGKIIFNGSFDELRQSKITTVTKSYLLGEKKISRVHIPIRQPQGYFLVKKASKNNLKDISVKIPLGVMTVFSGLSGSGKSTLLFDEFITQYTNDTLQEKSDIVIVDQKAIGRTRRSTIGTYFGLFDSIREIFALLPESKIRGLSKSSFSFNTGDKRCTLCLGSGVLIFEMEPLPKTKMICDRCMGKRYEKDILDIRYKEKNIFDVLSMSVKEACQFFAVHKKIKKRLQALLDVGLSYITLNQSSETFSGGELQRIKLAFEFVQKDASKIFILDEPTTGLHFEDIRLLLDVFDALLSRGNTLLVIEHNIDVIKYADYVIDMGPRGGLEGGTVCAEGSPNQIKNNPKSVTGKYL
jgi:excinuclease ABC subunit A